MSICFDDDSSPLSFLAPCEPTAVSADLQCSTGLVTVSWRSSAGATSYTVLAEANGHTDSCHSESTSCELGMLQCGRDYSVTVLAGDSKCNSSALANTSITTGEEQLRVLRNKTKLTSLLSTRESLIKVSSQRGNI